MTILYFDGFDQYIPVPEPTGTATQSVVILPTNILNGTAIGDEPMIALTTNTAFCRLKGDSRTWRTLSPTTPGTIGSNLYSVPFSGNHLIGLNYSPLSTGSKFAVDTLKPLSEHKSLTIGYKKKFAQNSLPSATYPHILAVFSATAAITSSAMTNTAFAVTLEGTNVRIRKISTAYVAADSFSAADFSVAPAGNLNIGACNFVTGDCGQAVGAACTPPIEELAANTVEIQVTAEGKVTVWINNQFVGSCTFADTSRVVNIRYVTMLSLGQRYLSSSTSSSSVYEFNAITDVYVLNGLGTRNTTRLGKVKVVSRLPVTDSAVQFSRPDTANTNASVAAQRPAVMNPSLTGVKEGDTDLYGSTAFGFTNEAIIATSVTTAGYKTDPTGNDIAPVLSVGGTKYVGSTNQVPISSTQMKQKQHVYEVNPKTGLPFTKTDLDATTFGVTVVAPTVSSEG